MTARVHPCSTSKRAIAERNLHSMIGAFEEHRSEAERNDNPQMELYYGIILEALYAAEIPNAAGQVKLVANFAGRGGAR